MRNVWYKIKYVISKKLGSRPLPFYYKKNREYFTLIMNWTHTFIALMMIFIIVSLAIYSYADFGRVVSITTYDVKSDAFNSKNADNIII